MKEIEWAELRINDGDGGDYLNIYSDDKTYSYLLEDVFERMNETDLARITAELEVKTLALKNIAQGCTNYTFGDCFTAGRTVDAEYSADRVCDACIAAAALKQSS